MRRPHGWLWFTVMGLACALSVDDPVEEGSSQRAPEAPVGNPFTNGVSRPAPGNGGRSGGSVGGAGGGQGRSGSGSEDRPGGAGGRVSPLDLPAFDAGREACEIDAGDACDVLCLSNDDCRAGLCVNALCRSFCDADGDCPTGQACALGLCRTSPSGTWECFLAGDCAAAEDCVSGSCLRRCSTNDHCAEAGDGAACSLGYCQP